MFNDRKFVRWIGYIGLLILPIVLFWPLRTRVEERRKILKHDNPVTGVVWSKDGRTLWTSTGGWNVQCWDMASRQKEPALKGDIGSIAQLTTTDDGRWLVGAADNPVKVQRWSAKGAATQNEVADPDNRRVATTYLLALLPTKDNRVLACSANIEGAANTQSADHVHLWDTLTGSVAALAVKMTVRLDARLSPKTVRRWPVGTPMDWCVCGTQKRQSCCAL